MILKRVYQNGGVFSGITYTPISINSNLQEEPSFGDSIFVDSDYVQMDTSGQPSFYQPKFDLSEGTKVPAQINPIIQEEEVQNDPTPEGSDNPMSGVTPKKEVAWVEPKVEASKKEDKPRGTVHFKGSIDVGNMQPVIDKFLESGINIRVTSGFRKNAKTSSGKDSWHASGEAIDITPAPGETLDQLLEQIKNSPELVNWLTENGYGILRETTQGALKRTKGSGYHLHIGKDAKAKEDLAALVQGKPPILAQFGAKFDKIKYAIVSPRETFNQRKAEIKEETSKHMHRSPEEKPRDIEISSYKPEFELFIDQATRQPFNHERTVVEHSDGTKTIHSGNAVELPIELPARKSTKFSEQSYKGNADMAADFIDRYYNMLLEKGVKDAKQKALILTAQDMLESGWGSSGLSKYNNFGGVKAGSHPSFIEIDTTEYKNGKPKTVKQKFRKFEDIEEFIDNKYDLYNNPERYGNALFESYSNFIDKVAKTYATAPDYAEKWKKVLNYLKKLNPEWVV